jgi:predicted nucleic acid-binding Zn ribbon protein
VRRRGEEPAPLSDVLNTLAGRLRKVDLRLVDEVRRRWPEVVDPVLAEHCRPEFIKNGVLVVSVPSGAFAERVVSESESILRGLASLGDAAPTALRTVVRDPS